MTAIASAPKVSAPRIARLARTSARSPSGFGARATGRPQWPQVSLPDRRAAMAGWEVNPGRFWQGNPGPWPKPSRRAVLQFGPDIETDDGRRSGVAGAGLPWAGRARS